MHRLGCCTVVGFVGIDGVIAQLCALSGGERHEPGAHRLQFFQCGGTEMVGVPVGVQHVADAAQIDGVGLCRNEYIRTGINQ